MFLLGFLIKKYKMSYLIAGYNTADKDEKEKYDEQKLVLYIGNLLMISSLFLILPGLFNFLIFSLDERIFSLSWISFTFFIISEVVFVNVSGCLKKS